MTEWRFSVVKGANLLIFLLGSLPMAAQQFQVVNRTLVSSTRLSRTGFDYTYRVDVHNTGAAATDVRATVVSSSPDTIIVDSELEFGDIFSGRVASSIGTFTVRQNREVPFDPAVSFQFRSRPGDVAPIANAGPDQIAVPGQITQLDGSGSYDPDGSIVAYEWAYVGSMPPGLPAVLLDPNAVKPTVLVATAAVHVFELVVTDDSGRKSSPARVIVTSGRVSNAGPDQTVKVGDTVQLDGTRSFDPEGRPLTFNWTLSAPNGGQAQLSDSHSARPAFNADVAGSYRADLSVSSSRGSSAPHTVAITAIQSGLICGDLISGSIVAGAQVDQYTFVGQANRIVTLTLADTGGWPFNAVAVATVFAPSGATVVGFAANGQKQITLTESGTYVVQVQASNLASTGTYNFGMECGNPAEIVDGVLSCGALAQGSIAKSAQVDQYTFDGQANRIVTLTLADTGGWPFNAVAVATVFAPSGQQVVSFGANGQQQITLMESGIYLVQVEASNLASTGTYNIGLVCLFCGAGSITTTSGTPQSTFVNKAFAGPLTATVKGGCGNPVSGVAVTFTVPSSGASGTFAGGVNTAITNAQGQATSAIFTANGIVGGPYTATASTAGIAISAGFSLTNTNGLPVPGDFDGNGVPDLLWQNDNTRQVTVWYMGGAGGAVFQGYNFLSAAGVPGWHVVAVADFNGDGVPDLVWQNDTTRQVTVWYMGGAGGAVFQGYNYLSAAGVPGWHVAAAADFNGDGVPDLVWQNDNTRQVTVWYMGGAGGAMFQSFNYLSAAGVPGWHVVAAVDQNGDGVPDLIWQNDSTRQVTVWYMGGAGGAVVQGWNYLSASGVPGWSALN